MTPQQIADAAAIDLGNATNFGNEAANMGERFFTVTIENNTTSDHEISLAPSYYTENAKLLTDGTIGGVTGLTASSGSEDVTIDQFVAATLHYPTRVLRTQIECDNSSQLSKTMTLAEKSVFGNKTPQKINLASYKNPANPNEKLITVTQQYQLDAETEVKLIVPKRIAEGTPTVTTITFFCGASYNADLALYRLAQAALSDSATAAAANSYLGAR